MENFYEEHYGQSPAPARIKAIAKVLAKEIAGDLRWLDIGCGSMDSSVALINELRRLNVKSKIDATGWDVSATAVNVVRGRGFAAEIKDVSACEIAPDEQGAWDIVLFLEVIEHLVDTDTALRNIHKLLAPNATMVISIPNLAAWYNRILLMAGYQPHGTEVSFERYRFGVQFLGRLFGEKPGVAETAVGHLRAFTLKALLELLDHHGFETKKVLGISNHRLDLVSKVVAKIWPGGAGNVVVIARRR